MHIIVQKYWFDNNHFIESVMIIVPMVTCASVWSPVMTGYK